MQFVFDVQGCFLVVISPIYEDENARLGLGFGRSEDWNQYRQQTLAAKKRQATFADKELLLTALPDTSIRVSPAVSGTDPIKSYSNIEAAGLVTARSQLHARPLLEAWNENLVS